MVLDSEQCTWRKGQKGVFASLSFQNIILLSRGCTVAAQSDLLLGPERKRRKNNWRIRIRTYEERIKTTVEHALGKVRKKMLGELGDTVVCIIVDYSPTIHSVQCSEKNHLYLPTKTHLYWNNHLLQNVAFPFPPRSNTVSMDFR